MWVKIMVKINNYSDVKKEKQNQILKLVTNSFYKELVNYGIDASDIVTVSVNLLDYITKGQQRVINGNGFYNKTFSLDEVVDRWQEKQELIYQNVKICPLPKDSVSLLSAWLKGSDNSQTFIGFFPRESGVLNEYLFGRPDRKYFGIYYEDDQLVGFIGAENIDQNFKKLEMKKYIGVDELRGKGIGKMATLLFLYYTFEILQYNKAYIHSLDTNIKNINLNSKFGFELEGILYEEAHLNGKYRDVLRMSLLADHWKYIFKR